jgi:hypothetical protein
MKENVDVKGVVDNTIKTATSRTLAVCRIREIMKANAHVRGYGRHSLIN